ncbi:MAG: recombination protein RecR [Acholeplasmataceae bacterium]|nr:recombination protein RecR [Acholeplasmataceae bacterium]
MNYPNALEELIFHFMKYPGVGRKTAERYALHTLGKISQEDLDDFSKALASVKSKIGRCSICGHLTDVDPCSVCADNNRDKGTILVVESPKDVFAIEKLGKYHGRYHVLHGAISPVDGVGPDDLNLKSLWNRIAEEQVKEVIIATSATQEGETTAMYIHRVITNTDVLVTRIGYGMPVGGNLEYADDKTLAKALEYRRKF